MKPPAHYNPLPMFGLRAIMVPWYYEHDTLDGTEMMKGGMRALKHHELVQTQIPFAGDEWERVLLAQNSDGSYVWLESDGDIWPMRGRA